MLLGLDKISYVILLPFDTKKLKNKLSNVALLTVLKHRRYCCYSASKLIQANLVMTCYCHWLFIRLDSINKRENKEYTTDRKNII